MYEELLVMVSLVFLLMSQGPVVIFSPSFKENYLCFFQLQLTLVLY